MSHAYIIQLDTEPIEDDNLVSEEDFFEDERFDYFETISDADREEVVDKIAKYVFPTGMFHKEGDCFIYQGGIEKWKEEYLKELNEILSKITTNNLWGIKGLFALKDKIQNALDQNKFVVECWSGFCANDSTEFMEFVDHYLKPGDKLYIGSIIDFHY